MSLFSTPRSPIGIDIGTRTIRAVQLARRAKSGAWCIESVASIPRQANIPGAALAPDEASRLRDVLDRRGFRGREVVLAVPAQQLMTSTLELPARGSGVPLEQIARMELARVHQRDAQSFEFDQWDIPAPARGAKATNVMAVACAHEDATPLLDSIEAQGLHVRALDAPAAAAARACAPKIRATSTQMHALLDVGWSGCRFALVYRGVLVYSRALDEAGLHSVTAALEQRLELAPEMVQELLSRASLATTGAEREDGGDDDDDDLADEARPVLVEHFDAVLKELRVSFSYAAYQYPNAPIASLLLFGGGAQIPGLAEHLQKRLDLVVAPVKPSELMDCNPEPVCRSAAIVTAIGLARHGDATDEGATA